MTPLDTAIFAANVVLAFTAAAVHMWAAVHVPFTKDRRRHQGIGLLALLYGCGYVTVLTGWVPILSWSSFFRGVSLVAWVLVWIVPAMASVRTWRAASAGAAEFVAHAKELGIHPARERHRTDG